MRLVNRVRASFIIWPALGLAGLYGCALAAERGGDAAEPATKLLYHFDFESGDAGEGVCEGWSFWKRELCETWLDAEVKKEGGFSQGCEADRRNGGPWSPPLTVEPGGLYRLSFWVKVERGALKVKGQGRLVHLNSRPVYTPENAGDWLHVSAVGRATPWHTSPPGHKDRIWPITESEDGAKFWIDDMRLERVLDDPDKLELADAEHAPPTGAVPAAKKLIACGNEAPLPRYVRDNIREMERAPFDGIVMHLTASSGRDFFSHRKIPVEAAEEAIADLQATEFRRFTHNFLWANVVVDMNKKHPDYHGDWFKETNWEAKLHNARLFGRVIEEAGLKGIMFDTEQYCGQVFDYTHQPDREKNDFDAYCKQVRKRGQQWMRAVNAACPDIEIMFMVTASDLYTKLWCDPHTAPEQTHLGLFPSFMDGIIDAATPQTKLIDGFEQAYNISTARDFAFAPELIRNGGARMSADPDRYARRIGVGFGKAPPWNDPDVLENAIYYALQNADQYVWIWNGCDWGQEATPNDPLKGTLYFIWWIGNAPRDRAAALMNAKLARQSPDRLDPANLSEYWGKKSPGYYAAVLAGKGFKTLPATLGMVEKDTTPTSGQARFDDQGPMAFDLDHRSLVLDLAEPREVDIIQLYTMFFHVTSRNPLKLGAYRLDETNVKLYVSNDNVSYRPVPAVYREINPFAIELSDIGVKARYFKVNADVGDGEWGFFLRRRTDTYNRGGAAFSKD